MEYDRSTFSGNGVFAQSLVSGLMSNDDDDDDGVSIRIVCARPHPSASSGRTSSNDVDVEDDEEEDDDDVRTWPIDLPENCAWGRLDRYGPWREYASMAYPTNEDVIMTRIANYEPTYVIAVDWHGMLAWESIVSRWGNISNVRDLGDDVVRFSSPWWDPRRDVRVLYFNFRVYSSSNWGDSSYSSSSSSSIGIKGEDDDMDDMSFYGEKERRSCDMADSIVCVSENDRIALRTLMGEEDRDVSVVDDDDEEEDDGIPHDYRIRHGKDVHVLHPPLRGDIRELAKTHYDDDNYEDVDVRGDDENDDVENDVDNDDDNENHNSGHRRVGSLDRYLPPEARYAIEGTVVGSSSSSLSSSSTTIDGTTMRHRRGVHRRAFVTCVVRLSPEKSPHNFVALLRILGGIDFLRRHRLVPLICGARSVVNYADGVVEDLRRLVMTDDDNDDGATSWPCVVLDRHMGPMELAAIFSRTAINVHPCLYDAYGMTMVEAAAFGAPSIVNGGGKVGAAVMLGEDEGCISVDLEGILESNGDDDDEKYSRCELVERLRQLLMPIDSSKQNAMERRTALRTIANEARSRALEWDELACGRKLFHILNELPLS